MMIINVGNVKNPKYYAEVEHDGHILSVSISQDPKKSNNHIIKIDGPDFFKIRIKKVLTYVPRKEKK